MNKNFFKLRNLLLIIFIIFNNQVLEAKFINTFMVRIGGSSLHVEDVPHMAKHDIIFCNRFHYDDIKKDSWGAIKAINGNAEIYLYTEVTLVSETTASNPVIYLTELGRYDNDRGHSMKNINKNNPNFFLLDDSGNRIEWRYPSDTRYWLDFGNADFQAYSAEATIADFYGQPWTADGVYSDHTWCIVSGTMFPPSTDIIFPTLYPKHSQWATAMNSMMASMTEDLHAVGLKFAGNRGPTWTNDYITAYNAWIAQDQSSFPMDVALEEGGIAVKAGTGDIQFFPEVKWKAHIDLYKNMQNTKVCILASTDLKSTSSSGTDNLGNSFNFWDAFYYAMGSYLLGKNETNNNSYFAFHYGSDPYNRVDLYYDEYDKIDLGRAIGTYQITSYSGKNIYWREFDDGFVYVNPTPYNVASISLPQKCIQRTKDNLYNPLTELNQITSINLNSHRAAILYKVKINTAKALNAPKNLIVIK